MDGKGRALDNATSVTIHDIGFSVPFNSFLDGFDNKFLGHGRNTAAHRRRNSVLAAPLLTCSGLFVSSRELKLKRPALRQRVGAWCRCVPILTLTVILIPFRTG